MTWRNVLLPGSTGACLRRRREGRGGLCPDRGVVVKQNGNCAKFIIKQKNTNKNIA